MVGMALHIYQATPLMVTPPALTLMMQSFKKQIFSVQILSFFWKNHHEYTFFVFLSYVVFFHLSLSPKESFSFFSFIHRIHFYTLSSKNRTELIKKWQHFFLKQNAFKRNCSFLLLVFLSSTYLEIFVIMCCTTQGHFASICVLDKQFMRNWPIIFLSLL